MKSIKKYLAVFILIAIGTIAILNGCKKNDVKKNDEAAEQSKAATIKAIKDKYGSISVPEMYSVNKVAEGFYVNKNGEEISIKKQRSGIQSTLSCTMDCNTASDPSELDLTYTLSYVQRFFYCGSTTGSEVTATWNISVPYTVLGQNPYNTALKSKGRMRFKNSSGSILTSNTNLQPITITANGADPNCGSNFLYTVTYTWAGVADSYFANGNTLECSLFAYNDCDLTANNYLTSWVSAMVFQGSGTYALPCSRIDKVWYNPATGSSSSQCATVAGAYVTCPGYPSGFTPTQYQQVQYRKRDNPGSNVWDNQSSPIEIGELPGSNSPSQTVTACCGVLNLKKIYQGAYSNGWLIRYRNRHTGCIDNNAPWVNGTYITEAWPY